MPRIKPLLIAVLLLVAGSDSVNAQALRLTIDSITYDGLVSYNDTAAVHKNDSTIRVYCLFSNDSVPVFSLQDSNLIFNAFIDSIDSLTANNFTYTLAVDTLAPGNSASVVLKFKNTSSNPLPALLPGGSSVVIWPVYLTYSHNQTSFFLFNDTSTADVNGPGALYDFIGYNHQSIYLQFNAPEQRTLELYDATGRKVYERQSDAADDEIDWGNLPAAVFILRLRQGEQSESIKLVHL